jgi:hypothetical protein
MGADSDRGSLSPFSEEDEKAQARVAEAFEQDGWNRVETAEPDEAVLSLSPDLARNSQRAQELLTQIRTQTPQSPAEIQNAWQIASDLSLDERFRRASIEALSRSVESEAQAALLRIADSSNHSIKERGLALAGVKPGSARDAAAVSLKQWIESEKFPEALKDQAAATWVARALIDGTSKDEALSEWSPRARARIRKTWGLLTSGRMESVRQGG